MGDIRAPLWILLSAVGILLLLVCVNVANLFPRALRTHTGELAVRFAQGTRRGSSQGSALLESLLVGGVAALPLARLAVRTLVLVAPGNLPQLHKISVDGPVLLFTLVGSVAAGLFFGLLAAWRASAVGTAINLTAGVRGPTDGRDRRLARRAWR